MVSDKRIICLGNVRIYIIPQSIITLANAGHGMGPCQVCRHVLQNGNLHASLSHITTVDSGSDTVLNLHRGQNTIPGIEFNSTFSLSMMYLI